MKLTKNQKNVLQYLKNANGKWISHTKIGKEVGGGNRNSSWASPICKKMVDKGIVKRHDCGWYASI